MDALTASDDIRRLADELRAICKVGVHWSADEPYHRDRYEHVRRVAARLFAVADTRAADEIERIVFRELTHIAPVPVVEAAIADEHGRLLLIQRADDGLWALPGGAIDMGETPVEGAKREALEETGLVVEATDLLGVWDSRLCETVSSLQLYMFVFLCRPVGTAVATTPHEVLDQDWFHHDRLPPLSPGHTVRVPASFAFLQAKVAYFDGRAT